MNIHSHSKLPHYAIFASLFNIFMHRCTFFRRPGIIHGVAVFVCHYRTMQKLAFSGARLLPSEGNTPSPLRYCPFGQYALPARLCAHCVARIHRAFSMACSRHSHARRASRKATQFRAIELLSIKDYAQNACKIVGSD